MLENEAGPPAACLQVRCRCSGGSPADLAIAAARHLLGDRRTAEPACRGGRGERFLLQGGDCAESFDDCDSDTIANKLKILLQMSLVLVHGGRSAVIRVGRFAGQYAKPRSDDFETRDGVTLPSYRGDLINRPEFTAEARTPDPAADAARLRARRADAEFHPRAGRRRLRRSCTTPSTGTSTSCTTRRMAEEYRRIVAQHRRVAALHGEYRSACHPGELNWVDFFTSHEGLHLPYEQAQTRHVPRREGWYNLSTHFPWIGDAHRRPGRRPRRVLPRHRATRSAVKIGPAIDARERWRGCSTILHPDDEPGRLTLIHRFGAGAIAECLPPLIEAVRALAARRVLWCCDPMHGNTETTAERRQDPAFRRHPRRARAGVRDPRRACGSRLGGVHFELTGENVTECIGGARGLSEADLKRDYKSHARSAAELRAGDRNGPLHRPQDARPERIPRVCLVDGALLG